MTAEGSIPASRAESRAASGALELRALDVQFGRALERWSRGLDGGDRARLGRLGARLSAELGRENVCLDLDALALEDGWPAAEELTDLLRRSGVAAVLDEGAGEAQGRAPLVLEGRRLWLGRLHGYEMRLAGRLLALGAEARLADGELERWAPRLRALFPDEADGAPNWQRLAAATALDRSLAVIAGGPGTGKTTTVTRLLALLLEAHEAPLLVRLAAPTGKAAARLTASLREARGQLQSSDLVAQPVLDAMPDTATTLHRLLGYRAPPGTFRHGPDAPIAADVVVVDEASMIDLRMMTQLVEALAPGARLVLLGDPDQLASVEAGRVLGDLCAWARAHPGANRFTTSAGARLQRLTQTDLAPRAGPDVPALADALCILERSRRFDAAGGLGRLAAAVHGGDADGVLALLDGADATLARLDPRASDAVLDAAVEGHAAALTALPEHTPRARLDGLGRFQLLCATRHGAQGVECMNARVDLALQRRGLVPHDERALEGRPVMVTVNDYGLGLYNGDVGVVLRDEAGVLRAWFEGPDGALRSLRASRLPAHETAWAMTVHKSQGSEYDRVLVLLDESDTGHATRELLYTALTRARSGAALGASEGAIRDCVGRRLQRASGLRDRLWPGLGAAPVEGDGGATPPA